jgi:cytochrome oxidase Cu insertion factor (SCO1/SenC/PrrC family)
LVIAVLAWQLSQRRSPEPLPVLYTLGGDFALDSTLGGTTRLSDFRGALVLLNFGYTGCPDVCPTALSRMGSVLERLPPGAAGRDRIRPLFVTLDPMVDTREPDVSQTGYAISHSAHIYLIDSTGRVRATFGQSVPVERMALTVSRLLGEPVSGPLAGLRSMLNET